MHKPGMLDGNVEASPLRRRGDHSVPVGCQGEFLIFTSFPAVLVRSKPGVGQRSSIGKDDFGLPGGKLLAIQEAAIGVIESGGVDARAAFALLGKRNFYSTSHPLRPPYQFRFLCMPSFSPGRALARGSRRSRLGLPSLVVTS